jgi:hypothetical protein
MILLICFRKEMQSLLAAIIILLKSKTHNKANLKDNPKPFTLNEHLRQVQCICFGNLYGSNCQFWTRGTRICPLSDLSIYNEMAVATTSCCQVAIPDWITLSGHIRILCFVSFEMDYKYSIFEKSQFNRLTVRWIYNSKENI